MAASAGLPPAGLARAAASDLRRGRAAAQSRAAQRLAVLLVLPGGLCLLPAFMALGVAPLVIDLLLGAV
jgi:tight adherence protein B